ncbi:FliM/FliN family flagellar motor switch protein [Sphingomonas sp. So64.6b]|uniref:FliM/FliN family flagellar motor switch protein n=1 Tax=Sphingomonas sp. So64.6b TaxID=2997354 RepID=UPI001603A23B|nr:FliM/FliN family flagellar motor C-terminal domain-containing protein [Sphingomonas sp. So64.6b]QNA82936.1 FliM/FliN family flagellar motor switch protein [Sphingomonas sp. So64.6b]
MQRIHRNWLPEPALGGAVLAGLLDDAIRQWSNHWFVRTVVRAIDPVTPPAAMSDLGDGGYWMKAGQSLAIAVPTATQLGLAARMLDTSAPEASLSDADRGIVEELARACLDNLALRVAQAFRVSDDMSWVVADGGEVPIIIAPRALDVGVDPQSSLLRIMVSEDLLIERLKAGMPTAPRGAALPPIAVGLALQSVAVSASLGRCSLTVAEMSELSEGDVLIFDRDVHKPLALVLDGMAVIPGKCTIDQDDDGLRLKLVEPINR